jgi:hypothetical protein
MYNAPGQKLRQAILVLNNLRNPEILSCLEGHRPLRKVRSMVRTVTGRLIGLPLRAEPHFALIEGERLNARQVEN